MSFAATWMDLEIILLSEVRKTNIIWYPLYVESKIGHKWTYPQNRNRLTDIENKLGVDKVGGMGGNSEIGMDMYTLLTLCIK